MKNFLKSVKTNCSLDLPYIPNYTRSIITDDSGPGKTNEKPIASNIFMNQKVNYQSSNEKNEELKKTFLKELMVLTKI